MSTQLKWCNRAHTALFPSQGSFSAGDARWCGYVETAVHVAKNPKGFSEVDLGKAKNILLAEGKLGLAARIEEEAAL